MSTQIQTTQPRALDVVARIAEFQGVAKVFAASGLFADVKGEAQCFVKIMAGAELGIPPFTAMGAFHIIQGKVCMSANTIAARIKASGRYDYRLVEKTPQKCVIDFYEHGRKVHTEVWDTVRAQKAGVKNMERYPEAMLFARCVTSGARAVAPDVVGQFYTPEELGAEIADDGDIVTVTTPAGAPAVIDAKDTTTAAGDTAQIRARIAELGQRANALIAELPPAEASLLSALVSAARAAYADRSATPETLEAAANDLAAFIEKHSEPVTQF